MPDLWFNNFTSQWSICNHQDSLQRIKCAIPGCSYLFHSWAFIGFKNWISHELSSSIHASPKTIIVRNGFFNDLFALQGSSRSNSISKDVLLSKFDHHLCLLLIVYIKERYFWYTPVDINNPKPIVILDV